MRRQSAKRSAARPAQAEARDACFARDRGQCQARIVTCGGRLDPHHIWRQGQGGPWEDWNLITLCDNCHRWVHEHPLLSWSHGWLVPSWTGENGCHAAAALRAARFTLAPWLTADEATETARQDARFDGAPRLVWPEFS